VTDQQAGDRQDQPSPGAAARLLTVAELDDGVRAVHGIDPDLDRDGLTGLTAVLLTLVLWRNSPLEDIHAAAAGLDDGQMLAANVEVTRLLHTHLHHEGVDWDTIVEVLTDPARPVAGTPLVITGTRPGPRSPHDRRADGGRHYSRGVSAAAAEPADPGRQGVPFADASPAQVRAALIPEDAADFDRQWREALTRAIESLDLTEVSETLASWRHVARVSSARGQDGYRRMMQQAERTLTTGERSAGNVPWATLEARLGL
jgi:hypothetical protein